MIGPKNLKGSAVSDSTSDSGFLLGLIGALQIGFVLYLYCIVAEKPARRAASRTANVLQTIRWTLSVINLRQNEVAKASGRNSKVANLQLPAFVLPHLHLAPPLGDTSVEFHQGLWRQRTTLRSKKVTPK